jgi:DNA polymerase III alpha subunit (gram-positive type)
MNDKLMQSQKLLHDSLFELYMQGGLELYLAGTRGLKRDLIIRLETSALTPEKGEIIHYYAVNRWDKEDEFDEWAKPSVALAAEAERILGVTNSQLSYCRPSDVILGEFMDFAETYITASANHYANYRI